MTHTVPRVTIKVKDGTVGFTESNGTTEPNGGGLFMVYLQAVNGDRRMQWVLFPPAMGKHIPNSPGSTKFLLLSREQAFAGNRSKWVHSHRNSAEFMSRDVKYARTMGFSEGSPVLVPLELDDYVAAWTGTTPHKALRAVDREISSVLRTRLK